MISLPPASCRATQGAPDRCLGAYVLDKNRNHVETFAARTVLLATGGCGKVYLYTTNPDIATGDGVAMAYRAGAGIGNMEFIQFHPTCLYHRKAKSFLISEAVRGEGGVLKDLAGAPFMDKYHPLQSLAPRDIVARAIDNEMKKSGADYVLLDITHKPADFVARALSQHLRHLPGAGHGHHARADPGRAGGALPVRRRDDDGGRADGDSGPLRGGGGGLHRLARGQPPGQQFASGGAGLRPSRRRPACGRTPIRSCDAPLPDWQSGKAHNVDELVVIHHNWDEIRRMMWDYVGIVRTNKRLQRARSRIANLREEIQQYYWDFIVTSDLLELRNIATVAELIITSALQRPESRGLHYNLDYPQPESGLGAAGQHSAQGALSAPGKGRVASPRRLLRQEPTDGSARPP